MENNKIFGYHLLVNCAGCDKEKISNKNNIENFVKKLIDKIDMTAYGEPQIVHFASHNPAAGGYTLLQLIETSNIAAHFVDDSGDAFFDIFSCKTFDRHIASSIIDQFFKPTSMVTEFFVRSNNSF